MATPSLTRRSFLSTSALVSIVLAGCITRSNQDGGGNGVSEMKFSFQDKNYGYTYISPTCDRFVEGKGNDNLPETEPIEISLNGRPRWVVSLPAVLDSQNGVLWGAVTDSGVEVHWKPEDGGSVTQVEITPKKADFPPVMTLENGLPALLEPLSDASKMTHPVKVGEEKMLYVSDKGDIVLSENGEEVDSLGIEALPDARILVDGDEAVVLGRATTKYGHGALGDRTEAAGIFLIKIDNGLSIETEIELDGPVVEGIVPIWTDINGDGKREIIVTLSDSQRGARIAYFDESGDRVATGPAIGQGNRWRHQLAVAPFSPSGERELAAVKTPHIGGALEFYNSEAEIVATVSGYSSHTIGSRNLDGGVAGDFDGDGSTEMVVPTDSRKDLAGIRRSQNNAEEVWRLNLGAELSTNISAVESNGVTLGVGTRDRRLLIWE